MARGAVSLENRTMKLNSMGENILFPTQENGGTLWNEDGLKATITSNDSWPKLVAFFCLPGGLKPGAEPVGGGGGTASAPGGGTAAAATSNTSDEARQEQDECNVKEYQENEAMLDAFASSKGRTPGDEDKAAGDATMDEAASTSTSGPSAGGGEDGEAKNGEGKEWMRLPVLLEAEPRKLHLLVAGLPVLLEAEPRKMHLLVAGLPVLLEAEPLQPKLRKVLLVIVLPEMMTNLRETLLCLRLPVPVLPKHVLVEERMAKLKMARANQVEWVGPIQE